MNINSLKNDYMFNIWMNNLMKKSIIIIIMLIIAFICFQLITCKDYEAEVIFHTKSENISFYCNIADTSSLRQKGLLDVNHLPDDRGMLFTYNQPTVVTYTMNNMPLSSGR